MSKQSRANRKKADRARIKAASLRANNFVGNLFFYKTCNKIRIDYLYVSSSYLGPKIHFSKHNYISELTFQDLKCIFEHKREFLYTPMINIQTGQEYVNIFELIEENLILRLAKIGN